MLPKTLRERRRHAVKRIIVEHVEASRKISKRSLEHVGKLRDDHRANESAKSIAGKFLTEYLQDCSIHGVKYLSNLRIKPSIVGKFFWALIMICSFLCRWTNFTPCTGSEFQYDIHRVCVSNWAKKLFTPHFPYDVSVCY